MQKTVLVTGATGNLGNAVCKQFVNSGWILIASVFNEDSRSAALTLGAATVHVGDVSQPHSVDELVASMSSLDAVVHLVGGIRAGQPIETTDTEVYESMIRLNVTTTFNIIRSTMPLLKRQGGSIVTVGAKSALHPEVNRAAYSAAKAAVVALTQSTAEEGRAYNVRANVIVPSVMWTTANLEWAENGEEKKWLRPEQIAAAILALCSPEMESVNGSVIPMFGGLSA